MDILADLTDRQIWERYIEPRLKQQKQAEQPRERDWSPGADPWTGKPYRELDRPEFRDEVRAATTGTPGKDCPVDFAGRVLSPEETLMSLVKMRLMSMAEYERAIAEARKLDQKGG